MEQKDSTSSHIKEVVVISPEELRKLGITEDSIRTSVSSPPTTPAASPNVKSSVKTSPIVLNEQVSRYYMKTLYGSSGSGMAPRPATLAKKSFPQPPTIVMSPSKKLVTAEQDVLNSKVCLPLMPTTTLKKVEGEDVTDLEEDTSHSDMKQPKKFIKVLSITSVQLPQHEIRDLVKPDKSVKIEEDIGKMHSSTPEETSPNPSEAKEDAMILNGIINRRFQSITSPSLETDDDITPPVLEPQNPSPEQQLEDIEDDIKPPILEPQNATVEEHLKSDGEEQTISDNEDIIPGKETAEISRLEKDPVKSNPKRTTTLNVEAQAGKQSLPAQTTPPATIMTFHMNTKDEIQLKVKSPEAKGTEVTRANAEKKGPIIKAQIKSVMKPLHVSTIDSSEKIEVDKPDEKIEEEKEKFEVYEIIKESLTPTKPTPKASGRQPKRSKRQPFVEERIIIRVEADESPITQSEIDESKSDPDVKRKRGQSNSHSELNQSDDKEAKDKKPRSLQSRSARKTRQMSYQEDDEEDFSPKVRRKSARKKHLNSDVHRDSMEKSAIENDTVADPNTSAEKKLGKTPLENQNMETPPANAPKKRGRPRKTPVDPTNLMPVKQEKVEEPPEGLESSKSGRKRKKVDYFAMENSFFEIEYGNMNNKRNEHKAQSQSVNEKEIVPSESPRKAKRKKRPKAEFDALVEDSSWTDTQSMTLKTPKRYSKTYSKSDKLKQEKVPDNGEDDKFSSRNLSEPEPKTYSKTTESDKGSGIINNEIVNDNDIVSINDIEEGREGSSEDRAGNANDTLESLNTTDLNETESDISGLELEKVDRSTRNYVRTGQTKEMLQNVFVAAMKTICDSAADGGSMSQQQESWSSPILSRRIGRPPKSGNYQDSTGDTTCALCRESVTLAEWTNHNIVEHYNLSWQLGEQPLDLEDPKVTLRKLKIAMKRLHRLECKTCANIFTVDTEYMDHIDKCSGIVSPNGTVKCVVCNNVIDRNEWQKHKLKMHNNLTWRKGDTPLDLRNQQMVMDILKMVLKQKRQLYCYRCQTSKKSIVGYLSHIAQCGQKEPKVACKICGRMMLPVSIPPHMKVHDMKVEDKRVCRSQLVGDIIKGDQKRRAAQKALNVISSLSKDLVQQESAQLYIKQEVFQIEDFFKQVLSKQLMEDRKVKCKYRECKEEYVEVDSLLNHMAQCEMKPLLWYVCKNCMLMTPDKGEITEHVLTYFNDDHPEYVVDEAEMQEAFYEQILRKRKLDESRMEKYPNFKAKPTFLLNVHKRRKELFACAFEYTLEFCNEHFTLSELFASLNYNKSDWCLVDDTEIETYLPKTERSCQVACTSIETYYKKPDTEHTCRTYEMFEVEQHEGSLTIFCGGPVHTMAWLPTPHMYLECDQLLAVAVANTFEAKYKMNANYSEPSGIQFWHFGVLKNKYQIPKPQLMCVLAVDIGPIWCLEWCPSGCYSQKEAKNDTMNRMGLLAVAGSTPTVHVYAVPFLAENERELIYKVKPLLKLKLCQDKESPNVKYFPSRISWSKASGHKYIAVGYTDGKVGIFDVECTSKLLRYKDKEDGVDVILPYKTIKAHKSCITVLSMIHLKGGNNWLLTGSYDKRVCTWDLNDNTNISYSYKKIPYDGTWLTNWMVHATVPDSFSTAILTLPATIKSHRDYLSDSSSVMQTNSTAMSISTSDWLNGMIQGNATGDISSCFPTQLVCSFDNEKIGDVKHMLGCTKLVNDPEADVLQNRMDKNNIMDYQWTTQRYKLLFCDLKLHRYSEAYKQLAAKVKAQNDTWQAAANQMDLYPMVSVNKVCFNPNCQASLYYAAGYQAGFIRLSYLKFLENDKQVV